MPLRLGTTISRSAKPISNWSSGAVEVAVAIDLLIVPLIVPLRAAPLGGCIGRRPVMCTGEWRATLVRYAGGNAARSHIGCASPVRKSTLKTASRRAVTHGVRYAELLGFSEHFRTRDFS